MPGRNFFWTDPMPSGERRLVVVDCPVLGLMQPGEAGNQRAAIDEAMLRMFVATAQARAAKGKAPAHLLLGHTTQRADTPIIGYLDHLRVELPWLRADVVITNPEAQQMFLRGELANWSAEFDPVRQFLWGLALIHGQEGHFSEEEGDFVPGQDISAPDGSRHAGVALAFAAANFSVDSDEVDGTLNLTRLSRGVALSMDPSIAQMIASMDQRMTAQEVAVSALRTTIDAIKGAVESMATAKVVAKAPEEAAADAKPDEVAAKPGEEQKPAPGEDGGEEQKAADAEKQETAPAPGDDEKKEKDKPMSIAALRAQMVASAVARFPHKSVVALRAEFEACNTPEDCTAKLAALEAAPVPPANETDPKANATTVVLSAQEYDKRVLAYQNKVVDYMREKGVAKSTALAHFREEGIALRAQSPANKALASKSHAHAELLERMTTVD